MTLEIIKTIVSIDGVIDNDSCNFYPAFGRLMGGMSEGLFLSQLYDWSIDKSHCTIGGTHSIENPNFWNCPKPSIVASHNSTVKVPPCGSIGGSLDV